MASAGEMTPPTGARAASWARAGGASKIAMTKMAMTMSVLMRPDRDISTPAKLHDISFPHRERRIRSDDTDVGRHVRKHRAKRPSAIVLAMRPASEACGKRHENGHEASAFERSRSE